MAKNPTPRMKDVADRCGVSESTVSHVINGTKFVSAETRERVLSALRELNYYRDSHARRLARGQSNFLGLVISDIENPFYPGLIKAFELAALGSGFEVLLCTTNYDPAQTDIAVRKMIENKCPGVAVMTSRVEPEVAKLLAEHGVASVFLDIDEPGTLSSNIRMNYAAGVKQIVKYLYDQGHRRFAVIAGPQNRASHVAYRQAIDEALAEQGLTATIIEGDNNVSSGEEAIGQLFANQPYPTAILCSNDLTAMSAMRTLRERGLQVPGDVSVAGADDVPFAALSHPPLTTVRIPRERLGALALEMLKEMLGQENAPGRESALETELVIRDSTGPAPKA